MKRGIFMKVKRVEYVKRGNTIYRKRKTIVELVEPDAYVVYGYRWSSTHSQWLPVQSTAYFDGVTRRDVGSLRLKQNADRYVELLCTYSGFEEMDPDELNTDTSKEDIHINNLIVEV